MKKKEMIPENNTACYMSIHLEIDNINPFN